jgi:hypothetical protein
MRRHLVITGALVAALAAPSAASAATQVQISPKFTNNKAGQGTSVAFGVKIKNDDGSIPPPSSRTVVHLPKGMKVNYKPFLRTICSKATIDENGPEACPKASRVGPQAKAHADAILGGTHIHEPATVDPFAGGLNNGHPLLELYADGRSPISVQITIEGELLSDSGKYSQKLDVAIPPIPTTPGAADASIVDFLVTVGATTKYKGKKVALVTVPKSCPKGGFNWGGDFSFVDGTTVSATAKTPCPKKSRKR